MHARHCAIVPVVAEGRITGLLTLDNISEMITINAVLGNDSGEALSARAKEEARV